MLRHSLQYVGGSLLSTHGSVNLIFSTPSVRQSVELTDQCFLFFLALLFFDSCGFDFRGFDFLVFALVVDAFFGATTFLGCLVGFGGAETTGFETSFATATGTTAAASPFFFPLPATGAIVAGATCVAAAAALAPRPRFVGGGGGGGGGGGASGFKNFMISVCERSFPSSSNMKTHWRSWGTPPSAVLCAVPSSPGAELSFALPATW